MAGSHRGKDSKEELNLVKTLRFHLCVNVNEKLQILYFQHFKSIGSLKKAPSFISLESVRNYAFLRSPWSFFGNLFLMESRQFFWS
jgi:hypothetical protein